MATEEGRVENETGLMVGKSRKTQWFDRFLWFSLGFTFCGNGWSGLDAHLWSSPSSPDRVISTLLCGLSSFFWINWEAKVKFVSLLCERSKGLPVRESLEPSSVGTGKRNRFRPVQHQAKGKGKCNLGSWES